MNSTGAPSRATKTASPTAVPDAGAERALRNLTYRLIVELGRTPTVQEAAEAWGANPAAVRTAWRRLHAEHALVLDAETGAIRMAAPFSGIPTPYRVWAAERWWYANCAWDAFGVCAALGVDGDIEAVCPDCGQTLRVGVRDRTPDVATLFWHCLVPAAQWWDDIVFT
jgi:hypothetical protein